DPLPFPTRRSSALQPFFLLLYNEGFFGNQRFVAYLEQGAALLNLLYLRPFVVLFLADKRLPKLFVKLLLFEREQPFGFEFVYFVELLHGLQLPACAVCCPRCLRGLGSRTESLYVFECLFLCVVALRLDCRDCLL